MSENTAPAVEKTAKTKQGTVIKAKMQKTVVVEVVHTHRHLKYPKAMKVRERYAVHDEKGCKAGDLVVIEETRPMSKTKRWKVREIVKQSSGIE